MITRYTDGLGALRASDFALLLAYAAALAAGYLAAAGWLFRRRPL